MKRDDYLESRKEQEERERDSVPLVEPPAPYGPAEEGPEVESNRHENK